MTAVDDVRMVRRRVITDGSAISVSAAAFAMVYGLAARQAGLSLLETMAMSAFVLGGASQFAALGLIAQGVPWAGIVLLTALLNARHLLYSASLAPWLAGTPRRVRAAAAHVLTDEAYALAMPAFRSLGRGDMGTYAIAAALPAVPWVLATSVGYLGGSLMPDPHDLAMDVVFPAAMAGLAVALIVDRRALVAALAGAAVGVGVALAVQPSVGVVAGGLAGPIVAMLLRATPPPGAPSTAGAPATAGTSSGPMA
jgi:predicted branched-subunit amino acid permease